MFRRQGIHGLPVHIVLGVLLPISASAQIRPATDAPRPRPPEESLRMFQTEAGFHVELVAAEPHLADPVAICFDALNNIYACEIHGYNIDGHFDIVELNKAGQLDKQVRRIQAPKWAQEKAKQFTYGIVRKLVDDDGDGRVNRSSVFADKLPACYGMVPARRGIIVLCAPDIYYLADRDGDGQAEIRTKLFSGFNEGELWSRTNHLVWGLDNWIYACAGRGGVQTIRGPGLATPVKLGNSNYRFKADGSVIEPATGGAGGFGLGLSDWGDQFLIHNSTNGLQVTPIPFHYQTRNPNVASPGNFHRSATYHDVYPVSRPHPWRSERGRQKAWRDFYGQGEARPNGSFTAACSPTFYRGGAFPVAYHGNLFSCESQQNLINRAIPKRQGARISLQRPRGFAQREFLASSEGWFRPVNLATGPDGALYVVDMYREIIEDYSAIPRYLQQQYGLNKGGDRGRIWRVVFDKQPPAEKLDLANANESALVKALSHPNAVWRETAQRLLIELGRKTCVADVQDLAHAGASPQARLHAMYTLAGLGALTPATLQRALRDEHFSLRLHALRLAERHLNAHVGLLETTLRMVEDHDAWVRLQLALTLGEARDPRAAAALAQLAAKHLDETWMRSAILSSVHESAHDLLAQLLKAHVPGRAPHSLLSPLCEMIGAEQHETAVARLLAATAHVRTSDAPQVQYLCLEGFVRGLDGRTLTVKDPQGRGALAQLLRSDSSQVSLLAYRIAKLVGADDLPDVQKMIDSASRRALDHQMTVEERQAAIDLLSGIDYSRLKPLIGQLLDARQPISIQRAAVDAIAGEEDADVAVRLLAGWKGYSPDLQARVLDTIMSRQNRLESLLEAMENGVVLPQTLSPLQRLLLLENPHERVRKRAAVLLSRTGRASLDRVLVSYRNALKGARDVARGKQVFAKNCAVCHKVGGEGHDVGPSLSSAMNRPDESLLVEILDPSASITQGFRSYQVVTTDGRVFNGVLSSESATSVTLRRDKGQQDVILRKDLDEFVAGSKSLMPDDLYRNISPSDMAHLLTYLRDVFGLPGKVKLTLFDDDAKFVELLSSGEGVAALDQSDVFTGQASLSVTPPQRYSARIPNWTFPIVEHPDQGQFRYLRLAWKADGKGAMVELAASGRWPDSKSAKRRYYSGQNTTEWQAQLVSTEVPKEWTVITVDLWKDNGDFTLTGIAPTAMGGTAKFDRIELLRSLDDVK